jgi:hypothetical protein
MFDKSMFDKFIVICGFVWDLILILLDNDRILLVLLDKRGDHL